MNHIELKTLLIKDFIDKNGKKRTLNNKSICDYFNNNEFIKNLIFEKTNFLDDNVNYNERIYCYVNELNDIPICDTCKAKLCFIKYSLGYGRFCSSDCRHNNNDVKNKRNKTNIERYGESVVSKSELIKKKNADTCFEKYGANSFVETDFFKQKVKSTNIEKFGAENVFSSDQIKKTIIETNIKKFGVVNISQKNIINSLEKLNDEKLMRKLRSSMNIEDMATEIGVCSSTIWNYLEKHNIERFSNSYAELEIMNFLKDLNVEVILHDRHLISPLELDLFIPSKNIAIEYDGLFWHSYNREETLEEKRKHLLKTKKCQEKNIKLLHIFENEWIDLTKKNIWKNIIKSNLGLNNKIHARKCIIKEISSKEAYDFLNIYHLQGGVFAKFNIGLFYEDDLVSVMTFSKSRFSNNHEWEMVRFCCKSGINVIGGSSKLLCFFKKEKQAKSLVSYADLRFSNGKMYEKIGMTKSNESSPNYKYFKSSSAILENRIKYQKHKLHNILSDFDSKLTESQNMFNYELKFD